jgi:hypothetical protein
LALQSILIADRALNHSNPYLISTEQVLEKVSQVVKYAKEQGLHLRELEPEVYDKEEGH